MKQNRGLYTRGGIGLTLIFASSLVLAAFAPDSTLPIRSNSIHVGITAMEIGHSREGRSINGWYFPGTTNKRAIVLSGVHGSELSAIDVANLVVKQLYDGRTPAYHTLIIPCLFPDNAVMAASVPGEIGSPANIGRYSKNAMSDPNRQMPVAGTAFDSSAALDSRGRAIENENRLLLQLIQQFQPERIISIHAIREKKFAGVFADPKTDANGTALGFSEDSALALRMAAYIQKHGGKVQGNLSGNAPNAKYHSDPAIAPAGTLQTRSSANGHSGGTSLGTWAATATKKISYVPNRDAITILTMEFPGARRPQDYVTSEERALCERTQLAYARSITDIFLM